VSGSFTLGRNADERWRGVGGAGEEEEAEK
jgi:hypothetical protein